MKHLLKGSFWYNPDANGITVLYTSLIDSKSIYGDDYKTTLESIMYGRPGRMPEHQSEFTLQQLVQVTAYLAWLRKRDKKPEE